MFYLGYILNILLKMQIFLFFVVNELLIFNVKLFFPKCCLVGLYHSIILFT